MVTFSFKRNNMFLWWQNFIPFFRGTLLCYVSPRHAKLARNNTCLINLCTTYNVMTVVRPLPYHSQLLQERWGRSNVSYIRVQRTITLFRFMIMFCGTNNIPHNVPHIQSKYGDNYVDYFTVPQNIVMDLNMLWPGRHMSILVLCTSITKT